MSKISVLVCDDVPRRGTEAVAAIRRAAGPTVDVETRVGPELENEIVNFYEHTVNPLMKGGDRKKSVFDQYDIVFVDSNLSEIHLGGFRLTAAAIIGYIRAFSLAKYIVTINRFPLRDFDLSNLSPNGGSLADLAVNTRHLSSRWLWFRERETGSTYCPWYWPTLMEVPTRRAHQLADLENLDDRIVEFFSFPEEGVAGLSDQACAALDPTTRSTGRVTFFDFYRKACDSLIPGEKDKLVKVGDHSAIRRIVVAEIEAWLYRHVLAPQSIVVDIPHLVSRVPVVLGRRVADLETWNGTVTSRRVPFGLSRSYFNEFLSERRFRKQHWFSVPVFWWGPIKADGVLDERQLAMNNEEVLDINFYEDVSEFHRSDTARGKSFRAEFLSTFNRRHIRRVPGIRYDPVDYILR